MRVSTHAAGAPRGEFGNLGLEPAGGVEKFRGSIALHPLLEDVDVGRLLVHFPHWHLMRAPVILGAFTVDFFRARPTLGRAEHDHGPAGSLGEAIPSRIGFYALNLANYVI